MKFLPLFCLSLPVLVACSDGESNALPEANKATASDTLSVGQALILDSSAPNDEAPKESWSLPDNPEAGTASVPKADTESDPAAETITPIIVAWNSALVDQIVPLDGSTSYASNGDTLTYSWTLSSVPEHSIAFIENPSHRSTFFVPDVIGTYTISLLASSPSVSESTEVTMLVENPRFVKISSFGNPVDVNTENLKCVIDLTTNLMWESKTTVPGIHSKDTLFRWEDNSLTTQSNSEAYCGYNDWRRPTMEEMLELLNSLEGQDKFFFPSIYREGGTSFFWSSRSIGADSAARIVSIRGVWSAYRGSKNEQHKIVLVRQN